MLSERKWRNEGIIQMLIGLFTTFCFIKLLWYSVESFTSQLAEPNKQMLEIILGAIAFQGAALFWIGFFVRRQQLSWSEVFGFQNTPPLGAVAVGLAVAIIVVPMAWILQRLSVELLTRFSVSADPQQIVKTFQDTKEVMTVEMLRQRVALGVSVILVAPIAEEMLFRGLLYPTFKQLGFPRLALWGTSTIFALLHANLPALIPFIFLAVVLVILYEKTDNLLAPITAHACFNTANFIYLIYESQINSFFTPK